MFGAVSTASQQKQLMNIGADNTSTQQQAIPVIYFAGTGRIALTWISPRYNLTGRNVSSSGGKGGKGSTGAAQKNWYCDIIAAACVCPDDFPVVQLDFVLVNNEVAYAGPLVRTYGQHYASFTLENYCQQCHIHWGTKDDPGDTLVAGNRGVLPGGAGQRDPSTWPIGGVTGDTMLNGVLLAGVPDPLSGHYDIHPPYRNVCTFHFKTFFMGSSTVMPNIEVILRRDCKFFSGSIASADQGINPMGPVYEIWTDDLFGAGAPDSTLDQTSFQAAKTVNDTNGISLAPVATQASSLRSFFADYIQYYYGFFRTKGRTLEAGVIPTGNFDQSGLLVLDDNDLTAEPQIAPGTLDNTKNYFALVISNREHWLNSDDTAARYVDQTNFDKVGERRPEWVQRPYFIDEAIAAFYITAYGLINSQEQQSGKIQCKRESLKAVQAALSTNLTGTNNDLVFTAASVIGAAGNAVTIQYVNPGTASHALTIAIVGTVITITLATNASSVITTIASAIAALNFTGLVTVANKAADNGTGVVTAMAAGALTGGSDSVRPGSLIKLNSTSYNETLLLQVTQIKLPASAGGSTELSVDRAPVVWPAFYSPPANSKPPDFQLTVAPILYQLIVELPRDLRDNVDIVQLAILALRPGNFVVGFNVYLSLDNVDYEKIEQQNHFAVLGQLTFDPSTLSGLKLWLKADSLVLNDGDAVGTWNDLSGLGNNATQATSANKPIFKAAIVNNRAVVRFDGVNDSLATPSLGLSQPTTIFVVGKQTSKTTSAHFVDSSSSSRQLVGFGSATGYFSLYAGGTAGSDSVDHSGAFHVISAVFNGASSFGYIDGTQKIAANVGTNGLGVVLVGSDGGAAFLTGDIAEILIFSGALSAAQRTSIEAYLSYQYGITVANTGIGYPATTSNPDVTLGAIIDLFGPDLARIVDQSDQARDDKTLLLWIDNEILSVGDITALGNGRYKIFTRRAQYGTTQADHNIGGNCWFMFRDDLLLLANANFIAAANLYFKLAPFSLLETYDVSLATDITLTLSTPPTLSPPAISPGPQSFSTSTISGVTKTNGSAAIGSSAGFTAAMVNQALSGTGIPPNTFMLSYTDASHATMSQNATDGATVTVTLGLAATVAGLPTGAVLRDQLDGSPVGASSMEWPKLSGAYTKLGIFQSCVLRAQYFMPDGSVSPEVIIAYTLVGSGSGGTPQCGSAFIYFTGTQGHTGGSIYSNCATSGATIYYSKNGAAFVTYTAPFSIVLNDEVEMYTTASGFADSTHSYFDNTDTRF